MPRGKPFGSFPGHDFIAFCTGPWMGKDSWLYRIKCECGWVEHADDYAESQESAAYHRTTASPGVRRPVEELLSKSFMFDSPPDLEWEEF